jgi:tRNA pseudouridine38-40 synthase
MLIYWLSEFFIVLKIVKWILDNRHFKIINVVLLMQRTECTKERMSRYFIELCFKGTNYHGWQVQSNASTVQSILESVLKTLTRENLKTTGAGRTDAGVHARIYTAHFDSDCPLFENKGDSLHKINALLPEDIAVHDVYRVVPDAHARFSALSRTYEYSISLIKDPFELQTSWYYPLHLDIEALNLSAQTLLQHIDFTSFSKLHSNTKTNICHIYEAGWHQYDHQLKFRIRADRFLRNMVRAIVGTMVDIGRGKLSQENFIRIIETKNRSMAANSAPAAGLTLIDIAYPPYTKA